MSVTQTSAPVGTIFLRPRPYTCNSGVLTLVPLLSESPHKQLRSTLPVETWCRVLMFVFAAPPTTIGSEERRARIGLVHLSKTFKNIVSPFFYAYPYFSTSQSLKAFTACLKKSDRTWDSLRRIPYSTPGRWVHTLDLSRIACMTPAERLAVDTCLTDLFPLTPFLIRLVLNNTVKMSRRALTALAAKDGTGFLRVLKGVKWDSMTPYYTAREDPLVGVIRACEGLEEIELFGPGLPDDSDEVPTPQLNTPPPTPIPPLSLPNLHSLMILSLHRSPLLDCFLRSSLPSLRNLMITPYDDVTSGQTSALVATHGDKLHTLAFHTPKTWPPARHATPRDLLRTSPSLRALSLTIPLPSLSAPTIAHPLRVISLPRPDPAYLCKLEAWLYLGLLQDLEEVHIREVKWIRPGMSSRAAETGVQGEMKEWQRRLARWRVSVLDVNGRENAP